MRRAKYTWSKLNTIVFCIFEGQGHKFQGHRVQRWVGKWFEPMAQVILSMQKSKILMVFNDCCDTFIKCFKNICGVFNYKSTSN